MFKRLPLACTEACCVCFYFWRLPFVRRVRTPDILPRCPPLRQVCRLSVSGRLLRSVWGSHGGCSGKPGPEHEVWPSFLFTLG